MSVRMRSNLSYRCFPHRTGLLILLMWCINARSQDIHFSQFDRVPFNLNPGLTGQFNGQYRFIGNQRSQWRSVTVPYRTLGLSAEMRDVTSQKLSAGLSLFNDQAGDSRLRSTLVNVTLAKSFALPFDKRWTLTPGIMLGFTSMKIDYTDLKYDNQWNGVLYDPGIDPQESYPRSSRGYFNLNAGATVSRAWEMRKRLTAGVALFNISSPRQSFFDDGYVKLDRRFNAHATWTQPINADWEVWPSMLIMLQGTYREWDLGGTAHYIISSKSHMYRSVYGGIFYRTRDAGFITAGMYYDDWSVGVSYDINTSDLRPATSGRGGFELSVIYILPPKPTAGPLKKVCPDYI